ncbi:MAG TPA: hypothetical protein VFX92_09280 [Candidatus Krumholzibacteria bacterium]|nr:hypothetical protein [Candidatus Krumholzibacteria bacterium]
MNRYCTLLMAVVLALTACATQEYEGDALRNQAPSVWLSAAPPEGSTGKYTVHVFWGGWDPDGEVTHYEYLVTDNTTGVFAPADTVGAQWMPVVANDSTFTFSADILTDTTATTQVAEFTRSHTFFVRSVDNDGLRSTEAAHRSFTSRTLSPEVTVLIPIRNQLNPADLPPIATFKWKATDYIDDRQTTQEPESVQFALASTVPFGGDFTRTIAHLNTPASAKQWSPWQDYTAPGDSGKSWTTPPQEFGTYIFAVRAKDEAGAVTPVLDEVTNVRRVRVSRRSTGPLFTLRNPYIGQIVTSSCSSPITILDLPAGIPVSFAMSASAEHYGGTVSGYRYGWDIADLTDPEQWETDFTPFVTSEARTSSRRFFFGTHTFTSEVIDNSGFCSRIEVKVNIVQFTMELNLLVVDDFRADESTQAGWGNVFGKGSLPNDDEHDAFWLDMVKNVAGFDPLRDVVQTSAAGGVPLTKLALYKTIIWSAYGDVGTPTTGTFPLLYTFIQHRAKNPTSSSASSGKVTPNLIGLAMAAGTHVLITGAQPVQNVVNRSLAPNVRYPLIFKYELEGSQTTAPTPEDAVGDESFVYKDLCLETLDFALTSNQRRRGNSLYCPVTLVRRPNATSLRDDTMREALPIDPAFPRLTLRPEAANPGSFYEENARGIDVEVYNPQYFGERCNFTPKGYRPCFQPIYGVGCRDVTEPTYNEPVAFWTSVYGDVIGAGAGAVAARSAVFGFAPVFFKPDEVRPAIEHIMFNEWQLPQKATTLSARSR